MPLKEAHHRPEFYLYNDLLLSEFPRALFSNTQNHTALNRLGRGTAYALRHQGVDLVMRLCRRGGMMRFFSKSTYWYTGLNNTRMWQELKLLEQMRTWHLPVPLPAAAYCKVRCGLWYSGALVTEQIPKAQTLSERLQGGALTAELWGQIGTVIAQFHNRGVLHADLNANNILLTEENLVFLIDFDKSEIQPPKVSWQSANLSRLLRSLHKQQRLNASYHFTPANWQSLLEAYQAQLQPA